MEIRNATRDDRADLVRLRAIMLEQVIGGPVPEQDLEVIEEFFGSWEYDDPFCLVAEEGGECSGASRRLSIGSSPAPRTPRACWR